MPPNFNYSKVIANWKRDVNSGKINVKPKNTGPKKSMLQQVVNEVRESQGLPPMNLKNSIINKTPFPEPRVAPVVPVAAPVVPVEAPVASNKSVKKWPTVKTSKTLPMHRKSRKNRKTRKSRKTRR